MVMVLCSGACKWIYTNISIMYTGVLLYTACNARLSNISYGRLSMPTCALQSRCLEGDIGNASLHAPSQVC